MNGVDFEEVDAITAKLHFREGIVHYVQTMGVKQEATVENPNDVESDDALDYVAVVVVAMEEVGDVLNVHYVVDVLEKRESKVEVNDAGETNDGVADD